MAHSQAELDAILRGLEGVEKTYFQAPTEGLVYPCIVYEPSPLSTYSKAADNIKYLFKKGYTVTVIDRSPDSKIPDLVEGLDHSRFDRFFRVDGLNHFVFEIFF